MKKRVYYHSAVCDALITKKSGESEYVYECEFSVQVQW